ncbi:hypothetical protein [Streptomyces achromogenes]|uniref:hypothetical protein n=1 Tax=Streptomyces achromogenes TaxID=67255 RepID=UPI00342B9F8C
MGVPEWLGDIPTWIGAGGAIGAAWFAYQTIKSQRQQIGEQQEFIAEQSQFMAEQMRFMGEQQQNLELERAELKAQAEERRVEQSKQVKMEFRSAGSSRIDEFGEPNGFDHWFVKVTNSSSDPIHDVTVRFGDTYNAASAYDRLAMHPDPGRRPVPVQLIPAGGQFAFTSPLWSEATVENNRPALLFTAANGIRWRLDSYGKLEEVSSEDG